MKPFTIFSALPVLLVCAGTCDENSYEADIVVYGGNSPAVSAAVQASRMGKSVIIVSPDEHLGGQILRCPTSLDGIRSGFGLLMHILICAITLSPTFIFRVLIRPGMVSG